MDVMMPTMDSPKWILWFVPLSLCLLSGCQQTEEAGRDAGAPVSAESAVATVNGVPIYKKELESSLNYAQKKLSKGTALSPSQQAELQERILNKRIEDELLVQYARKMGIKPTEAELENKMAAIQKSGGSDGALDEFLQQTGLDITLLKANLERNLILERLLDDLRSKETVGDGEIAQYFDTHQEEFRSPETVECAHILFRPGENKSKIKDKASQVRQEILAGISFEAAAKKYSEDAATRELGGKLGILTKGEVLTDLEPMLFSLKIGEVSMPVESSQGVHLLRVIRRIPGVLRPLAEIKSEIREKLVNLRAQETMSELTKRLAAEGRIQGQSE